MTATITSPRHDLLAIRLAELRTERDRAQLELLGAAGGDAADRATNVDANIRFALLEQRIQTVELGLADRPTVRHRDDTVTVGDVVTLDLGDGPEPFLIGSVDEAAGMAAAAMGVAGMGVAGTAVLTPTSPLGRVVVGAQVGDTLTYYPRRGRAMLATVIAIG